MKLHKSIKNGLKLYIVSSYSVQQRSLYNTQPHLVSIKYSLFSPLYSISLYFSSFPSKKFSGLPPTNETIIKTLQ